jgi:UDP-N-acetylmuramate dehydrogenase
VAFDKPMSRRTSLRVGGPADALVWPQSRAVLAQVVALCRDCAVPTSVLGLGFNTLVREGGLRGVVFQLRGLREVRREQGGHLFAEAGGSHSEVSRFCARERLAGLEFAAGIPGSVGGWIRMNAGIPEREMKDVVESIECLDLPSGEIRTLQAGELGWHYRRLELPDDHWVLAARFATEPGDGDQIHQRARERLEQRRARQPIDQSSCGSVFKNPPGDHAGRLIEAAGLKGATIGGAQISELHANFIVNRGEGTASDVLALIERARSEVLRLFGTELQPEVQLIGESL